MGAVVGPGIRARMDEVGDEAVTHEWTEFHGNARVVKAWGERGLYIASNDSGEWRATGPFGGAE